MPVLKHTALQVSRVHHVSSLQFPGQRGFCRRPGGDKTLLNSSAWGSGVWDGEGRSRIASQCQPIFLKVACHLHGTQFHFPVVCSILAMLCSLCWKGQKLLKSTLYASCWPGSSESSLQCKVSLRAEEGNAPTRENQASQNNPSQTD